MATKPTFFNNYTATAASGVGGFDDYIEVDTLPVDLDPSLAATYAQGSIEVPITVSYDNAGTTVHLNMVCRGYTDTPTNRLFIDSLSGSSIGSSCAVICTLNRATLAAFQSTRMQQIATYSGVADASVDVGCNATVSVGIAGTITWVNGATPNAGLADYQNFTSGLATARILFNDATNTQPTITWADSSSPGIEWESGSAPQFQVGKNNMLVTIVGGQFASVQHFV